jgi:hypothetical protein
MLRFARFHAAFSLGRSATGKRARQLAKLRHLVDVPALLVMRLSECFEHLHTMTEEDFLEALSLIESYILRRAICGLQTRGYWQIFASLAYTIGAQDTLTKLKVALARQRDNYRFPSDEEFKRALKENDLYGLRVCRHLLEGLENHGSKEPTDTTAYSIEHILPQNDRLRNDWRKMLGDNWKEVQKTWLHRLGNLTLTGYNSKYSDRTFEEKKTTEGGFADSSVRLNKFVREQPVWTAKEISVRTDTLAKRAALIWPELSVDQSLIDAADVLEKRELAKRQDLSKVTMSDDAKLLFAELKARIFEIDQNVLELAEPKSISYHGPHFFLEVLPRRYRISLLLASILTKSTIRRDLHKMPLNGSFS